ncbi:hypothetical protein ACLFMI_14205 [Pseudonocardia nantongensis]|uniref:hypothetical protein n=1 Tax=Pseudonocardia nantongensis TaxID=1181885 RepID=UPI00397AFD9F
MPVRPATTPPALPALLALLLPLVLLLAGCSGSSGAPLADPDPDAVVLPKYHDPRRLLADVGARMHADGSAQLSLEGTLTGTSGPIPVTGDGALLFDRARPGAEPAVRLELRSGGTSAGTGLIRTGGRTWLRPPGAGWLEAGRDPMPAGTESSANGTSTSTESSTGGTSTSAEAMIAANAAAGADPLVDVSRYADAVLVADAVDERVDGVPAVRYTLVVDLARAITAEADPARRAALQAQQQAGTTRLSSEIWLDAERHPVQGRIRRSLPGAGTLELVTHYRDWGSPVTVDPPAAG